MAPARAVPPAQRPHPSKLFVEVTTRCNLRCAMCVKYAPGQGTRRRRHDGRDVRAPRARVPAPRGARPQRDRRAAAPPRTRALHRAGARRHAGVGLDRLPDQRPAHRRSGAPTRSSRRASTASASPPTPSVPRCSAQIHGGARQSQILSATEALQGAAAAPWTPPRSRPRVRRHAQQPPGAAAPRPLGGRPGLRLPDRDAHAPVRRDRWPTRPPSVPTTDRALALFEEWRARGPRPKGSASPTTASRRGSTRTRRSGVPTSFVRRMVDDASRQGISLKIADLMAFDHGRVREVESVFDEAAALAAERGLDLQLPRTVPTQVRPVRLRRGRVGLRLVGRQAPPLLLPLAPVRLPPRGGQQARRAARLRRRRPSVRSSTSGTARSGARSAAR